MSNQSQSNLRACFLELYQVIISRREEDNDDDKSVRNIHNKYMHSSDDQRHLLSDFMNHAGEPITWIESIELWYDMRSTNISKLPSLDDSIHSSLRASNHSRGALLSSNHVQAESDVLTKDFNSNSGTDVLDTFTVSPQVKEEGKSVLCNNTEYSSTIFDDLNPDSLDNDALIEVARNIKDIYSIRQSDDKSELKFISVSLLLLWIAMGSLAITGKFYPEHKTIGSLTWEVFVEALVLFVAELIWESILSAIVLRYNIKINYTRKLGNLFKIPKYFAADFLPFYDSTVTSTVTALAVNQTLFCLMYYRKLRERFSFCSYVFLSQDRREDRPDTLTFQVTEDLLRFIVYIPFKFFVANKLGAPELIFIPIAVNNIGDGLAEPIGVRFGKHKYATTALYHKGTFFKSKFTRSYEGSSCVFFTTMIVIAVTYKSFSSTQFWITISLLPLLMTIAEAKAPHTNDGPFLALVGCGFLTLVLSYV